MSEFSARPILDFETDADLCIIGSGIVALMIARNIAARGWGVVIVAPGRFEEAAQIPTLALPALRWMQPAPSSERNPHAREYFAATLAALSNLRIDAEPMTGASSIRGRGLLCGFANDDTGGARFEVDRIAKELDYALLALDPRGIADRIGRHNFTSAVLDTSAFHVDPIRFHARLEREALNHGVRLFLDSPVTSIDDHSLRLRVRVAKGSVRCEHLLRVGPVASVQGYRARGRVALETRRSFDGIVERAGLDQGRVIVDENAARIESALTARSPSPRLARKLLAQTQARLLPDSTGTIELLPPLASRKAHSLGPLLRWNGSVIEVDATPADGLSGAGLVALTLERILVDKNADAKDFAQRDADPSKWKRINPLRWFFRR